MGEARWTSAATFRKSAKPLAPPPRGSEIDLLAVLQESIRESVEKRKKTPGRPELNVRAAPAALC